MKKELIYLVLIMSIAFAFISCDGNSTKEKKEPVTEEIIEDENIDIEKDQYISKRAATTDLIGEYNLQYITGAMGANTLLDYYIEDNEWIAEGSSTTAGVREGFELDLSDDLLARLNSMKINVNEDLSISLNCIDQTIFSAPFNNDGMDYKLTNSPEDMIMMPEGITSETTFKEDYLYFYAENELAENIISVIDILDIWGDVAVIRYDIKKEQFELMFFYGDCCASSTYHFNK